MRLQNFLPQFTVAVFLVSYLSLWFTDLKEVKDGSLKMLNLAMTLAGASASGWVFLGDLESAFRFALYMAILDAVLQLSIFSGLVQSENNKKRLRLTTFGLQGATLAAVGSVLSVKKIVPEELTLNVLRGTDITPSWWLLFVSFACILIVSIALSSLVERPESLPATVSGIITIGAIVACIVVFGLAVKEVEWKPLSVAFSWVAVLCTLGLLYSLWTAELSPPPERSGRKEKNEQDSWNPLHIVSLGVFLPIAVATAYYALGTFRGVIIITLVSIGISPRSIAAFGDELIEIAVILIVNTGMQIWLIMGRLTPKSARFLTYRFTLFVLRAAAITALLRLKESVVPAITFPVPPTTAKEAAWLVIFQVAPCALLSLVLCAQVRARLWTIQLALLAFAVMSLVSPIMTLLEASQPQR